MRNSTSFVKRLIVQVSPNAKTNCIYGWIWHQFQPLLKISVKSPPQQGLANHAIQKLLAQQFKISKQEIRLISGLSSKIKTLELQLPNQEDWLTFLQKFPMPD